jgi:hypothetical protein
LYNFVVDDFLARIICYFKILFEVVIFWNSKFELLVAHLNKYAIYCVLLG